MKRLSLVLAGTTFALLWSGCDHDVYEIEMSPRDKRIDRKLTVWRTGSEQEGQFTELSAEALKAVRKAYPGAEPKRDKGKLIFEATFTGKTPDDVGGAGRFRRYTSKMGSAWVYIERFRGNDAPADVLADSMAAADRLTDILIGWLEAEFGKHGDFAKLRTFMDKRLRRDLKNLSVYSYLAANGTRGNWLDDKEVRGTAAGEVVGRIVQYFLERGYFTLEDAPAITRALNAKGGEELSRMAALVTRRICALAGIPDSGLRESLAKLLGSGEKAKKSLNAYLVTTPEHKAALAKWRKQPQTDTTTKPDEPDPGEIMEHLVQRMVHFDFRIADDTVRVRLETVAKPVHTNGWWDAKTGTVSWRAPLTERGKKTGQLPEICYAAWSRPDGKFQKNHLGKVALKGKDLLDYCLWRAGLNDAEAKRWNALLGDLKPGKNLKAQLRRFRAAATQPARGQQAIPYLKRGAEMILDALKQKPEAPAQDK